MVEKKWTQRNSKGGALYKWETPGQELIGTLSAVKPGKHGKLAEILTANGEVTIALSAALKEIADLDTGTEIRIVYEGWKQAKSGQEFRAFLWFTSEDSTPPSESDADVVPF